MHWHFLFFALFVFAPTTAFSQRFVRSRPSSCTHPVFYILVVVFPPPAVFQRMVFEPGSHDSLTVTTCGRDGLHSICGAYWCQEQRDDTSCACASVYFSRLCTSSPEIPFGAAAFVSKDIPAHRSWTLTYGIAGGEARLAGGINRKAHGDAVPQMQKRCVLTWSP